MGRYAASHLLWIVDGMGYTSRQTATTALRALAGGARLLADRFPKTREATIHVRAATPEETAAFIAEVEAEGRDQIPETCLLRRQAAGALRGKPA